MLLRVAHSFLPANWTAMTRRLQQHVERYGQSHRAAGNRLFHFLGIPLLLVGSLGLLSKLGIPVNVPGLRPDLGWAALLVAISWSLRMGGLDGVLSAGLYVAGYLLGSTLSIPILGCMTAAGVIAHLVGHFGIEHRPPALLSRPVAILEALPWLLTIAIPWLGMQRGRDA